MTKTPDHIWLYVLRLKQGKYYVGITTRFNPNMRIEQHGGPKGARWTALYKPVETLEIRDLQRHTWQQALKEEHRVTLEYGKRYGYNNVRGGRLTYRGNYVRLFDHYLTFYNWQVFRTIVFLMLCIIALVVLYLIKT